jgi:hypothetical protein
MKTKEITINAISNAFWKILKLHIIVIVVYTI